MAMLLSHPRRQRRAFSLLELLLAATFTAAACTAASLLIKSISDAAATSSGLYAGATAARDALACMDQLSEQAAMIGYWDDDRILLWRSDDNKDSQINVLELTLIRHDPASHELSLRDVRFPAGTPIATINLQNTAVPLSQFIALTGPQLVEQHPNVHVRRLVGGLSQFKAWCDGTDAKAQTAQVTFAVAGNDGEQAFHAVMTLRTRTRDTVP